ncbi:MAG: ATP-binding protein [Clostridia bacterium]|nr:ATP-binding protein [Clostridia bacterium]
MQTPNSIKVPRRILASLISSLSAGVVPRSGTPYIAIGRDEEIRAMLGDLERISEGEGSVRFLIGRYGSGKSFLMQLIRGYALEKGFLTADADLSPERRLYGSGGNGLATYKELIRNMATKASPDGAALQKLLAKWISSLQMKVMEDGIVENDAAFAASVEKEILSVVREIEFSVGGFDFARIISAYYRAYISGDDEKQSACLRWLRGEYSNKTEAKGMLGFAVSTVIDDDNWYDFIKLWAVLARRIGYHGFVVFIDECVNLYKITNRVSRENNYEKILSMFNDTLQGHAEGLAIVFGGTPQFLDDTRRGIFSYEALRSRLCDSKYEMAGVRNLNTPIIRLTRLGDNELFALLKRLTDLFGEYYGQVPRITEQEIAAFLKHNTARAGSDIMVTPREMIRDYMTVLNLLSQNETLSFEDIMRAQKSSATEKEESKESTEPRKITAKDIVF